MKKLSLLVLLATLSTPVFAATYQCSVVKNGIDKGEMTVKLDVYGNVQAVGNYAASFDGDAQDIQTQPSFTCAGKPTLQETKAAYFKKWFVFYFTEGNKNCSESSIRIRKDDKGNADFSRMELVNYNGDNHDYSGYQALDFDCKAI